MADNTESKEIKELKKRIKELEQQLQALQQFIGGK